MAGRKPTEAASEKLTQEKSIGIGEIGDKGAIEQATEGDIDLKLFMEDILTVHVHQASREDENPVIIPSVNAINQPIIRGRDQKIKRKYVEALARSRVTEYDQVVRDASKPESIEMVPRGSLSYPFAVTNDPHPHGREWLNQILMQP